MIINFNKNFFYKKYNELIESAYKYALEILKVPCKELEVNISYVSSKTIREINKQFRNNDKTTDVLSFPTLLEAGVKDEQIIVNMLTKDQFPFDINNESGHIFIGDICICTSVVRKQAKSFENSLEREFVYMAVHGLLHLLGFDHMKDVDKQHMRQVEEKIMKKMNLERN